MNKFSTKGCIHPLAGLTGAIFAAAIAVTISVASHAGPEPTPPAGWREAVEMPEAGQNRVDPAGEPDSYAPVPTPPAAPLPTSEAPVAPAAPATPYAPDERDC